MKLRMRVALAVLPAAMLAPIAISALFQGQAREALLSEVRQRALWRVEQMARVAAPALAHRDEKSLLSVLYSEVPSEPGSFARVVSCDGRVIAHTDLAKTGRRLAPRERERLEAVEEPAQWLETAGGRPMLFAASPIFRHSSSQGEEFLLAGRKPLRLGVVQLGLPLDHMDRTLDWITGLLWKTMVGIIMVMALIALILLDRVLAPVRKLLRAVRLIEEGEYGVQVEGGSTDELGELADSFNQMSRGLKRNTVSLEHHEKVLESMQEALFETGPEGRVVSLNRAACELIGLGQEEAVGRKLETFFKDEFSPSGPRSLDTQLSVPGREGHPVFVSASPLAAAGGSKGFIVTARDMSEHRRMETELRQAQKLEAVGRLAGGIAHDFNNLLTCILGNAQFLLESLGGEDPNRADVEEIVRSGKRAASLTQQLLAFSRRQSLKPETLDLNAAASGLDLMLRRLIGEHIRLTLKLSSAPAWVRADKGQIEQVLMNLVLNARDALPRGGNIILTIAVRGERVLLDVQDDGVGMAPEIASLIFDPFFTTKEPGQGTGLGLALVHGIVNQSGGSIEVETEPGKGALFRISLPLADAGVQEPAPKSEPASPGSGTLLIAEDETGLRRLCARSLEGAGYRVVSAKDGAEALETLRRGSPPIDLLLTDVVMPELNGIELVREARALRPGLPCLFMSGYLDDAVSRCGGIPSDCALLEKPFQMRDLIARVGSILGRG